MSKPSDEITDYCDLDRSDLDEIERQLGRGEMAMVESAEQEIVGNHHGDSLTVPEAVVAEQLLVNIYDLQVKLAKDNPNTGITYLDAKKYVLARTLANCVGDEWNPFYQES